MLKLRGRHKGRRCFQTTMPADGQIARPIPSSGDIGSSRLRSSSSHTTRCHAPEKVGSCVAIPSGLDRESKSKTSCRSLYLNRESCTGTQCVFRERRLRSLPVEAGTARRRSHQSIYAAQMSPLGRLRIDNDLDELSVIAGTFGRVDIMYA